MAEPSPEDIASDSRMGLLLDASKLGMSLSDLSDALKKATPAVAAAAPAAAAAAAAAGAPAAAPPAAGIAATEAQHELIQQRRVASENAALKGTGPADLTVLRYGDFASTTIPGERVPQNAEFLMDRRLFDQNFSSDKPIVDSTFYFHLPKKEKKEIIRF
jgi:ribosomal protein L12E/L44/L45/RPP1/RPP2